MDQAELERCWHRHARHVFTYAERHVGHESAADVVTATFLTAWRSWTTPPPDPLPWLLSVAHGQVRNTWRAARRQRALADRVALLDAAAPEADQTSLTAEARTAALAALAGLSDRDREALLLVAWDGLSPEQAATVAGCRPGAFRTRLQRARQRLESALDEREDLDVGRSR